MRFTLAQIGGLPCFAAAISLGELIPAELALRIIRNKKQNHRGGRIGIDAKAGGDHGKVVTRA